jgi:hypothetical protein
MDSGTRRLRRNGEQVRQEGGSEVVHQGKTEYRAVTARQNCLAQDSPDLVYPMLECSGGMANPERGDWEKLKKVARFLVGRDGVAWRYECQESGKEVGVYTDSDWVGCLKTRKSSNGGCRPQPLYQIPDTRTAKPRHPDPPETLPPSLIFPSPHAPDSPYHHCTPTSGTPDPANPGPGSSAVPSPRDIQSFLDARPHYPPPASPARHSSSASSSPSPYQSAPSLASYVSSPPHSPKPQPFHFNVLPKILISFRSTSGPKTPLTFTSNHFLLSPSIHFNYFPWPSKVKSSP